MLLPGMYDVVYVIWLPLLSTFLVPNMTVGNNVSYSDILSTRINTRHSTDLHLPASKFTIFQRELIILELRFLIIFHPALRFYLTKCNNLDQL